MQRQEAGYWGRMSLHWPYLYDPRAPAATSSNSFTSSAIYVSSSPSPSEIAIESSSPVEQTPVLSCKSARALHRWSIGYTAQTTVYHESEHAAPDFHRASEATRSALNSWSTCSPGHLPSLETAASLSGEHPRTPPASDWALLTSVISCLELTSWALVDTTNWIV